MTKAQALWGRRCLDNGGQEFLSLWNPDGISSLLTGMCSVLKHEFPRNLKETVLRFQALLYTSVPLHLWPLSARLTLPLYWLLGNLSRLSSELTDPMKICHKHIKFNMPKPNPLYLPLQVFILSLFKSELLFTSLPCSTLLRHFFLQEDFLFSTSEHVLPFSTYHIKLPTSVFSRSCCTALCTAPGTL